MPQPQQVLTYTMGRFRVSHSFMGFAMGVYPCLPASIMAMLRMELSLREFLPLCKHTDHEGKSKGTSRHIQSPAKYRSPGAI